MGLLMACAGGAWNDLFGGGPNPLFGTCGSQIGGPDWRPNAFWDRGGSGGLRALGPDGTRSGLSDLEMPHYLGNASGGVAIGNDQRGAYPSSWAYRKFGRGFVALAGDLYLEVPWSGSKNREAMSVMKMAPLGPRPIGPPGPCEVEIGFNQKTLAQLFTAAAGTMTATNSLTDPRQSWATNQWAGYYVHMTWTVSSTTFESTMRIVSNDATHLYGNPNDLQTPVVLGSANNAGIPCDGSQATAAQTAWTRLPDANMQGIQYSIFQPATWQFELSQSWWGTDWGPSNQAFVAVGRTRCAYDVEGLGRGRQPLHLEFICRGKRRENAVAATRADPRAFTWAYELWVNGQLDAVLDGNTQASTAFGNDLGYPFGFGIGMTDYGTSQSGKGGGGSTGGLNGRMGMFNVYAWDDLDCEPNTAPLYAGATIPDIDHRIMVTLRRPNVDGSIPSVSSSWLESNSVTGTEVKIDSLVAAGGISPVVDMGKASYPGELIVGAWDTTARPSDLNWQNAGWRHRFSKAIVSAAGSLGIPMEPLNRMEVPVQPTDKILGVYSWCALVSNDGGSGVGWCPGQIQHVLTPEMLFDISGCTGPNWSGLYGMAQMAPDGRPWTWDKLNRSQMLCTFHPRSGEANNPAYPNDFVFGPYPPEGWTTKNSFQKTTRGRLFLGAGEFVVFLRGAERNPGAAGERTRKVSVIT